MKIIALKQTRIISAILIGLSIFIRIYVFPASNRDMDIFNLKWYQLLIDNGIIPTLATNFTNYNPPYTYLLALTTATKKVIPPIIALKLIPTFFDTVTAYFIYKLARLKYVDGGVPYLAMAVYFSAPTIIINSSYWGQVDSLYVCFLILCLYCILTERSALALIAFGVSFSIKAQALFFAPFLLIYALRKKKLQKLLLIPPLVYLIMVFPPILFGRGVIDTLFIYFNQAGAYKFLSVAAPNLYLLFSRDSYSLMLPIGLVIACVLISYWSYLTYKAQSPNLEGNILLALISVALVPFLLPKMHDRYFYPADVLSIILSFFMPQLWYIPILYQFISISAVSIFLIDAKEGLLVFALLANLFSIATLIKTQMERSLLSESIVTKTLPLLYKWSFSILTPLLLFGLGSHIFISSTFYKIQFRLAQGLSDSTKIAYQNRIQEVAKILIYMEGETETEYLYKEAKDSNTITLSKYEAYYLQDVRFYWGKTNRILDISFIVAYLICLLAWAQGSVAKLREGLQIGGAFTIFLAGLSILIVPIKLNQPLNFIAPLAEISVLRVLFPPSYLWSICISLFLFVLLSGIGLQFIQKPTR